MSAYEAPVGGPHEDVAGWSQGPPPFDVSTAHPARVYDYLLGGKDNFAADRVAAEAIIEVSPVVFACVRANRAFLRRAVRYLARDAGIRQFLDIGTGLPTADNTHHVAQQIAPECKVAYVDNDPIVLAHARALLTSAPEGVCAYIDADLRDTDTVLRHAAETLDFTEPVAVMVLCTMQYVPDTDRPHAIIARLMNAVSSGSFLAMSDTTRDIDTQAMTTGAARYNAQLGPTVFTPRTGAEYARFFDGLSLIEPGLVPMPQWRPDPGPDLAEVIPMYAAVGRKA
ncbi:MAG TPA: SAM-dependent methyltransferase [Trebonia sp.]